MKRSVIALALVSNLSLALPGAADHADDADDVTFQLRQKDSAASARSFKKGEFQYTSRLGSSGNVAAMKIVRRGSTILKAESEGKFAQIWLVSPLVNARKPSTKFNSRRFIADVCGMRPVRSSTPFTDITGDGVPDVVVGEYSGGVHCCYSYKIYSLGRTTKVVDTLFGNHTQFVFVDLDRDGKFEAVGMDWIFAYWKTGFAQSPAQTVILKLGNHGYELAPELMRTLPPTRNDMQDLIDQCESVLPEPSGRPDETFTVPSELWSSMMALIYTGHSAKAWQLLNHVWPRGMRGELDEEKPAISKEQFRRQFLKKLRDSTYWNGIQKLNKSDPRMRMPP